MDGSLGVFIAAADVGRLGCFQLRSVLQVTKFIHSILLLFMKFEIYLLLFRAHELDGCLTVDHFFSKNNLNNNYLMLSLAFMFGTKISNINSMYKLYSISGNCKDPQLQNYTASTTNLSDEEVSELEM